VSAPEPEEIFERTREEGQRRLNRPFPEVFSTGLAAGVDVAFGVVALAVISSLFEKRFGPHVAHFFGSLGFGIAFIFIVVGRSELFTENFLVPIAGLDRTDRRSWWKLFELWTVSPITNVIGGLALALILSSHKVLPHGTGKSMITISNEIEARSFLSAFLSAVAAGALITMMTWFVEGQESMGVRAAVAWIVGTLLALASFNHVIVVTIEMIFGHRYGAPWGWSHVVTNFFTALVGNMIGGILFVTLNRANQAKGGKSSSSA
jgi:formate/nitrite transporter FocA (FNT family)